MSNRLVFGVIGLGRMGGHLAENALKQGMTVVGMDLHEPDKKLTNTGLIFTKTFEGFKQLPRPRIIFAYVPSGHVIDDFAKQMIDELDEGDILVDGGNSYWGDSIRRHAAYIKQGLHFIDLGTSGGIAGAEHGACFMIGGEPEAVEHVAPILKALACENGYAHAGPPGSGHFVKLVHNGIEYGMLQAIGEGMDLLEKCPLDINMNDTLNVYRHGSVIRSWLIDLMADMYQGNKESFADISSYVDDTGEVNWLVDDAMHMEVPVPVISMAVMQLIASRESDDQRIAAKAVAMMRHAFGGHAYGESQVSKDERYKGRDGGYYFAGTKPKSHYSKK